MLNKIFCKTKLESDMKNAMTFDDIYLSKDSAVKLVLKEIDVMDLEYAFSFKT